MRTRLFCLLGKALDSKSLLHPAVGCGEDTFEILEYGDAFVMTVPFKRPFSLRRVARRSAERVESRSFEKTAITTSCD